MWSFPIPPGGDPCAGLGLDLEQLILFSLRKSTQKRISPPGFGIKTTGDAQALVEGLIIPSANMSLTSHSILVACFPLAQYGRDWIGVSPPYQSHARPNGFA